MLPDGTRIREILKQVQNDNILCSNRVNTARQVQFDSQRRKITLPNLRADCVLACPAFTVAFALVELRLADAHEVWGHFQALVIHDELKRLLQ